MECFSCNGRPALLSTGQLLFSQRSWLTLKLMPAAVTDKMLLPSKATRRAALILDAIRRVASICQTLQLTTAELEYITYKCRPEMRTGYRSQCTGPEGLGPTTKVSRAKGQIKQQQQQSQPDYTLFVDAQHY